MKSDITNAYDPDAALPKLDVERVFLYRPETDWTYCHHLVLSLSEDGARFDRHAILADEPYAMKRAGMHKGGEYGYPHTMVHDGHLYAIVSRQKEAVEVMRVRMASP